jgi:hypothetical protein
LYNKQLSTLLNNPADNVPFVSEIPVPPTAGPKSSLPPRKPKKILEVEEMTRWTMFKTIF